MLKKRALEMLYFLWAYLGLGQDCRSKDARSKGVDLKGIGGGGASKVGGASRVGLSTSIYTCAKRGLYEDELEWRRRI